jgi:hypothetical protein
LQAQRFACARRPLCAVVEQERGLMVLPCRHVPSPLCPTQRGQGHRGLHHVSGSIKY